MLVARRHGSAQFRCTPNFITLTASKEMAHDYTFPEPDINRSR